MNIYRSGKGQGILKLVREIGKGLEKSGNSKVIGYSSLQKTLLCVMRKDELSVEIVQAQLPPYLGTFEEKNLLPREQIHPFKSSPQNIKYSWNC